MGARTYFTKMRCRHAGCYKCGSTKSAYLDKGMYSKCVACGHSVPWHYDTVLPQPTSAGMFLYAVWLWGYHPEPPKVFLSLKKSMEKAARKDSTWFRGKQLKGYHRLVELAEKTWEAADLRPTMDRINNPLPTPNLPSDWE